VGQTGEHGVGFAPQITIDVLLHAHIIARVVEIESDRCKARGGDRLEQRSEETVRLRALRVARDKRQFPEVWEPQILEAVGVVGYLQSASNAGEAARGANLVRSRKKYKASGQAWNKIRGKGTEGLDLR